ncbi:MAG: 4-hydroxy-tetrahydrodipicolinate reductase [Endomicrobiales bacterium]|nr:4-hydroxy-tetrahydrodipicolinate reductase [Endomicrobiales bacterium]
MLKIAICGAAGRMGSRIIVLAQNNPELCIVAGIERKELQKNCPNNIKLSDNLSDVIELCDIIIDFTAPDVTLKNVALAKEKNKPIVIGTTGFDAQKLQVIANASKDIPILLSPNMSLGVNLLFKLSAIAAKALNGYDIEIVELHHNQKKDAPSGTAAKLAEIMALALDRDIAKVGVYGREGIVGARTKEEIGVMAVRAGDTVGEHTVYFAGTGERIELTHRAYSRDILASGALTAAKWLSKQVAGFYSMQDVLSLNKL